MRTRVAGRGNAVRWLAVVIALGAMIASTVAMPATVNAAATVKVELRRCPAGTAPASPEATLAAACELVTEATTFGLVAGGLEQPRRRDTKAGAASWPAVQPGPFVLTIEGADQGAAAAVFCGAGPSSLTKIEQDADGAIKGTIGDSAAFLCRWYLLPATAEPTPSPTVAPPTPTRTATASPPPPTPTRTATAPPPPPTPAPTKAPTAAPSPTASPTATSEAVAVQGELVNIGQRSLYLECAGAGSPTVILEAGGPGDGAESWGTVFEELAKSARVCRYDRAGLGKSDPPAGANRTVQDSVNDLAALIRAAKIACPCVLVGESWGGVVLRLFVSQHSAQVAGLVIVNGYPRGFLDALQTALPSEAPERGVLLGAENPEGADVRRSLLLADIAPLPSTLPAVVIVGALPFETPDGVDRVVLESAWTSKQVDDAIALGARLGLAEASGAAVAESNPALIVESVLAVVSAVAAPEAAGTVLQLRTVDAGDQAIVGVCFQVYLDAGGGTRGDFQGGACDRDNDGGENGVVTLLPLPPGAYVIENVVVPEGYELQPDRPLTLSGFAQLVTIQFGGGGGGSPTPTTTPAAPRPTSEASPEPTEEAEVEIEAIDLGTLDGVASTASDVNASGRIAGYSDAADETRQAVVWARRRPSGLPSLGGEESTALGINDAGQIVGRSQRSDGVFAATLWDDGEPIELVTLGGPESRAYDINEKGQIAGRADLEKGVFHAVIWEDGQVRDLGTLGGRTSSALAINEEGQVAGISDTADGAQHAFLWTDGQMVDLGALSGDYSMAFGINDAGVVVGESRTESGALHAVKWVDGEIVDLNPRRARESAASDVDAEGRVVGRVVDRQGVEHAVVWIDRTTVDLGTLGGEVSRAFGINDDGEVVGVAQNEDGASHAVLWRTEGLPEPEDE